MREVLAFVSGSVARVARVSGAGALAHAALVRSGGLTRTLPGFEATGFRFAASELVWVGHAAPLHPRVALVEAGAPDDALDLEATKIYAPRTLPRLDPERAIARNFASRAVLRLIAHAEPSGFAMLFAGRRPAFPESHRAEAALALAAACAKNDAGEFTASASRLLGAGSGLTPSGDDFVGGALFARRLVGMDEGWQRAAGHIVSLAPSRTHAISSALLSDLAAGSSYAALHDLADAIFANDGEHTVDLHMQTLAGIGHSSGWDMLAGFISGLAGRLDFSRN